MKKPNILLLFTDQQRFDTIAALGNPVIATPNLDRLVRKGCSFTRAYTPSPVCVPARCCMHYGQYAAHTGCTYNGQPFPENRPSYADLLTEAGYRTHAIGKRHFVPDGPRGFQTLEQQEEIVSDPDQDDYMRHLRKRGHTHINDPHGMRGEMYYMPQPAQMSADDHPTQWVGNRSVAFIEEQTEEDPPWMLYSGFIHPHPPFSPPAPWHSLYRAPDMPLPKMPEDHEALWMWVNRFQNRYKYRDSGRDLNHLRCMKAFYYACISFIDYQIGRILDSLERSGQLENTLILFSSDHGELLGDYGCFGKRSMHDSSARIPLLARFPERFTADSRCNAPASLVDIMPTLLSAAGIAMPEECDGVDLKDVAAGNVQRPCVFSQFKRGDGGLYAAFNENGSYIYSSTGDRDWYFDTHHDPEQTRSRVASPRCANQIQTLRSSLLGHLRQHDADALDGDGFRAYPPYQHPLDPDANLITQDQPWADHSIPGYSD